MRFSLVDLASRLAWPFGCLFLGALALMATVGFQDSLYQAARAFGAPVLGVLGWALLPLAGGTAWGLAKAAPSRWVEGPAAFWGGLGLLLALRVGLVLAVDAPLISDFLEYHQLALGVAQGGPWLSELRPAGYSVVLAAAYALIGPHVWVAELVNVGWGLAGGALLYGLAKEAWGARAGAIALWAFALWPGHLLMTPLVGSEVAYATCFIAALWAGLIGARGHWGWMAAAGVVLGLSQYVRPTSLVLLPLWGLLPWLVGQLPMRRALKASLAALAAFVIVLVPAALDNYRHSGHVSLSTSNWGGWSLLVGANQQHGGAWNVDDAAAMARYTDLRERDRAARKAAKARIAADPLGYAGLMVRKFPTMWASEHYAPYWLWGTAQPVPERRMAAGLVLCQGFYALALWAALAGWVRGRRRLGALGIVLAGAWAVVAVAHAALEVQSRYHFYLVPTFVMLAAAWPRRGREAIENETRAA